MTTQVTLYGTRFCPYCVGARRFLEERRIPYEEIAVDEQPEKRGELVASVQASFWTTVDELFSALDQEDPAAPCR